VAPEGLVGIGEITSPNPTATGNTKTTSDSDKGSGDFAAHIGDVSHKAYLKRKKKKKKSEE